MDAAAMEQKKAAKHRRLTIALTSLESLEAAVQKALINVRGGLASDDYKGWSRHAICSSKGDIFEFQELDGKEPMTWFLM
jgi:hypothetical protein